MALGFLKLNYKTHVLDYSDESTPTKLTGKKMLPIFDFGDAAMNESIDIIKKLDKSNEIKFSKSVGDLEMITKSIGGFVHPLAMPVWVYTKEFNEKSRKYFIAKKEKSKGPFSDIYKKRDVYIKMAYDFFYKNKDFFSFTPNTKLGDHILIASHLYGLYLVPDFSFPDFVHDFMQNVRETCHFDYHADFWK